MRSQLQFLFTAATVVAACEGGLATPILDPAYVVAMGWGYTGCDSGGARKHCCLAGSCALQWSCSSTKFELEGCVVIWIWARAWHRL